MICGDDFPLTPSGPEYGAIENISIFDECEIHENCTVQIWRNSKTGEVSIGWWPNENL